MEDQELRQSRGGYVNPDEFADAVDLASGQDTKTWIVDADGKRIAAIVPVDVAEAHEAAIDQVLHTSVGRPEVKYPDVTVHLSTGVNGNTGAVMGAVSRAMRDQGVSLRDIAAFREAVFRCDSQDEVLRLVMTLVNVE